MKLLLLVHLVHLCYMYTPPAEFPETVDDISSYKPITATSTCGADGAETYCGYDGLIEDSLASCSIGTCNDSCPFSDTSPTPFNLTTIGSGIDIIYTDTGPGFTGEIANFMNDDFILVPAADAPQISNDKGFTFASWIKQSSNANGTLLSKAGINDQQLPLYAITASATHVTLSYSSEWERSFNVSLPSQYWHHVTVTMYKEDLSLYINGTILEATGVGSAIIDNIDTDLYVGQNPNGKFTYTGLMEDIYFYTQALTQREVEEVVRGVLLDVIHTPYGERYVPGSHCHCPPSLPRINPASLMYCVQNEGGVGQARAHELRLNGDSHTAGLINYDDQSWISAISHTDASANVSIELVRGSQSVYEISYVQIRFEAPPPKAAILEHSNDGGQTYQPLKYFATAEDCSHYFNDNTDCVIGYSSPLNVPVTMRLKFQANPFVADHIRLRMRDFATNITGQHRYYSISHLNVKGRCACNGHAQKCASDDLTGLCTCLHNTQGDRCGECLPLYNDKPWREGIEGDAFPCKLCNCNNHATSCYYNASLDPYPDDHYNGGGGVCINCLDNTAGRYCETCVEGYYRKAGVNASDDDPCTPCHCNSIGSIGIDCVKVLENGTEALGQCSCKTNVEGLQCDRCKEGYFNFSSSTDGCEPETIHSAITPPPSAAFESSSSSYMAIPTSTSSAVLGSSNTLMTMPVSSTTIINMKTLMVTSVTSTMLESVMITPSATSESNASTKISMMITPISSIMIESSIDSKTSLVPSTVLSSSYSTNLTMITPTIVLESSIMMESMETSILVITSVSSSTVLFSSNNAKLITPTTMLQSSNSTGTITPTTALQLSNSTGMITPTTVLQSNNSTEMITPTTALQSSNSTEMITPTTALQLSNSTGTITPTTALQLSNSTGMITPTTVLQSSNSTEMITPTTALQSSNSTEMITPTTALQLSNSTETITPTTALQLSNSTETITPLQSSNSTEMVTPTTVLQLSNSTEMVTPTTVLQSSNSTETITPTTVLQSSNSTEMITLAPTTLLQSSMVMESTETLGLSNSIEMIHPTTVLQSSNIETITPATVLQLSNITEMITPSNSTEMVTPTTVLQSSDSTEMVTTTTVLQSSNITETITPLQSSNSTEMVTPTAVLQSSNSTEMITLDPTTLLQSSMVMESTETLGLSNSIEMIHPTTVLQSSNSTETITPTTVLQLSNSTETITPTTVLQSSNSIEMVTPTTVLQSSDSTEMVTPATVLQSSNSTEMITPTTVLQLSNSTEMVTPTTVLQSSNSTEMITPTTVLQLSNSTETITPTTVLKSSASTSASILIVTSSTINQMESSEPSMILSISTKTLKSSVSTRTSVAVLESSISSIIAPIPSTVSDTPKMLTPDPTISNTGTEIIIVSSTVLRLSSSACAETVLVTSYITGGIVGGVAGLGGVLLLTLLCMVVGIMRYKKWKKKYHNRVWPFEHGDIESLTQGLIAASERRADSQSLSSLSQRHGGDDAWQRESLIRSQNEEEEQQMEPAAGMFEKSAAFSMREPDFGITGFAPRFIHFNSCDPHDQEQLNADLSELVSQLEPSLPVDQNGGTNPSELLANRAFKSNTKHTSIFVQPLARRPQNQNMYHHQGQLGSVTVQYSPSELAQLRGNPVICN